jgi:ferrous iron transport protein B
MARAAVIMDRLMRGVGLHGQSFVPLLSSFACAVPGILATRTIADRPSRLTTMLVAPLMSCSARLPVYTLLIGAFFADREVFGFLSTAGLVMTGLYVVGIIAALLMAKLFRGTLAKGPTPPLILELPPYRIPSIRNVLRDLGNRGWMFLKRAGTVILVFSVILWGLQRFPRQDETTERFESERASLEELVSGSDSTAAQSAEEKLAHLDVRLAAVRSEESLAGTIGHGIEPVLRPLGFDWRIGVGILASLAAREVFVAGMSCVFSVEDGEETGFARLQTSLADARDTTTGERSYSPLTGVSLLVFFCLACQCIATLAAIRRETGSWRWPTFTFVYMTALAWLASFVVYQGGQALGF